MHYVFLYARQKFILVREAGYNKYIVITAVFRQQIDCGIYIGFDGYFFAGYIGKFKSYRKIVCVFAGKDNFVSL